MILSKSEPLKRERERERERERGGDGKNGKRTDRQTDKEERKKKFKEYAKERRKINPSCYLQNYADGVDKIPAACITVEDAEMLQRMYDRGIFSLSVFSPFSTYLALVFYFLSSL